MIDLEKIWIVNYYEGFPNTETKREQMNLCDVEVHKSIEIIKNCAQHLLRKHGYESKEYASFRSLNRHPWTSINKCLLIKIENLPSINKALYKLSIMYDLKIL